MAVITEIRLANWKSYVKSTLYIDQLSVLIGTNAGGKSNALDALVFLNRITSGSLLTASLQGDGIQTAIRGGLDWAPRHPVKEFTLGATIKGDELTDYEYEITCSINENRCELVAEQLIRIKYRQKKDGTRGAISGEIKLFRTDPLYKRATRYCCASLQREARNTPAARTRGRGDFSASWTEKSF